MRINLLVLLVMLLTSVASFAQSNSDVSGTVVELGTNEPLIGAFVIVEGTDLGAATDIDGSFALSDVPTDAILTISYLGYTTISVSVYDVQAGPIALSPESAKLDEVVVIGYGSQTKKEITGAVSVISSKSIESLNPTNIEQALQGQTAGVQITGTSGAPGSGSNIRIRGISTNGDNRPLILVDGNVVEDLSVINPNDIESINILKDATAGIYGVRAANGVILITTKTGRKNTALKIDFNAYTGQQFTSRKMPLMNAIEYGALINEAHVAGGSAVPFPNFATFGAGTDWQDEVFDNAPITNFNLTASGGSKKSTYSLGGSYLAQDGIVGKDKAGFERTTLRANYGTAIAQKVKIDGSFIYTYTSRSTLSENALGSVLFNALNMGPNLTVFDDNGDYTLAEGFGNEVINPVAQIANTHNNGKVNKYSGRLGVNIPLINNLSANTAFQFNSADVEGFFFAPIAFYGSGKVFNNDRSVVGENNSLFEDYTYDLTLNYENTFEAHKLKGLLGMSVFKTTGVFTGFTGFDIPDNDVANASIANASDVVNNFAPLTEGRFDTRLLSYFARAQYDFKNKYLISAVVRRDGSTAFGPQNRFGYFPSVSVGWVLSEEDFVKSSKSIDFAKFRASYGIIGNDRIAGNAFRSVLSGEAAYVFDDQLVFGQAIGTLSNPEIKWEEQKTLNVGLDLSLFNEVVDITVDYFIKRTDDLLVSPPVSGILGASAPGSGAPIVNAGDIENKGLEFHIGYVNNISEKVRLSADINFTTLQNKVLSVNNGIGFIAGGGFGVGQDPPARMEAGLPIGYFYGYETNGLFQSTADVEAHAIQSNAKPGDLRFVDQNNDGIINPDDRVNIGNPIPDMTLGLNFQIDYSGFDFRASGFGSIGNEIVRNYERQQALTNKTSYYLGRWTGANSTDAFPRITTGASPNTLFSDFYVEDGSFFRLQNVQIGYTFSSNSLEKLKMDKLRIYLSANNLLTLTKYQGFDPTISNGAPIGGGFDQGFYPTPTTILFGINAKF